MIEEDMVFDLEVLKELMKKNNLSAVDVSSRSGVPISTVYKVLQGHTANPRPETIEALKGAVLLREDSSYQVDGTAAKKRKEKKQGEYTVEDYKNWPEDERIELIDGVIYLMSSPRIRHQAVLSKIFTTLYNYVDEKGGPCMVFPAPIDVQLDRDEKTMVVPDVVVVCDPGILHEGEVFGAPDFIAEVLSPSTRMRDMMLKLNKYKAAGVREYWVVDPKKRIVTVFWFEKDQQEFYTFQDEIPVGIYDGECIICLKEVQKQLESLNM